MATKTWSVKKKKITNSYLAQGMAILVVVGRVFFLGKKRIKMTWKQRGEFCGFFFFFLYGGNFNRIMMKCFHGG